jgi:hypothetical protein
LGLAAHFHFLHVVSIDYCFCDLIHALGYQKRLYRMLGDSLSNFYLNWLLMMNLSSNIVSMFAFSLCGMDLPLNLLPECQLLDCQEQQGRKQ